MRASRARLGGSGRTLGVALVVLVAAVFSSLPRSCVAAMAAPPRQLGGYQESAAQNQRVLIFRFAPQAAQESEAALRTSLENQRLKFLDALERKYRRRKLEARTVQQAEFRRLTEAFQSQNPSFPVTSELAQAWALGKPSPPPEFTEPLIQVMREHVRDDLPDWALAAGSAKARVVAEGRPDGVTAGARPHLEAPLTALLTLAQARQVLMQGVPPEQQAQGRFIAGFLKPNSLFDEALTRQHWQRQSPLAFGGPGQEVSRSLVWGATGSVVVGLVAWGVRRRRRSRQAAPAAKMLGMEPAYTAIVDPARNETVFVPVQRSTSLPATTQEPQVVVDKVEPPVLPERLKESGLTRSREWEERVLAAEKRAEELFEMVRTGLAPYLARHMMGRIVRELIAQRDQLLSTHLVAAAELEQVETRFARLSEQLQERIRAYETRNAELERALSARLDENHQLLRANMEMIRKLEADLAKEQAAGGY